MPIKQRFFLSIKSVLSQGFRLLHKAGNPLFINTAGENTIFFKGRPDKSAVCRGKNGVAVRFITAGATENGGVPGDLFDFDNLGNVRLTARSGSGNDQTLCMASVQQRFGLLCQRAAVPSPLIK